MESSDREIRVRDATRTYFSKVPHSLHREAGHKPNHIALYSALSMVASWDTHEAFVSRERLLELAGFSRSDQLYGSRRWLQERGYLAVDVSVGGRRATTYTVLAGPGAEPGADRTRQVGADRTRQVGADRTRQVGADRTDLPNPSSESPSSTTTAGNEALAIWRAVAAALPDVTRGIVEGHSDFQDLLATLSQFVAIECSPAFVVERVIDDHPPVNDPGVRSPFRVLQHRCRTALANTIASRDADERRARQRCIEAEEAAARAEQQRLQTGRDAIADELLASLTPQERERLRAEARQATVDAGELGPSGREPIRARVRAREREAALKRLEGPVLDRLVEERLAS